MAGYVMKSIGHTAMLSGSATAFYTCPSGKNAIITFGNICNRKPEEIRVNLVARISGNDFDILREHPIPERGTIRFIQNEKLILSQNETLTVSSNLPNSADIVISLIEKPY